MTSIDEMTSDVCYEISKMLELDDIVNIIIIYK